MATPEEVRKLQVAALMASIEVSNHLSGIIGEKVAKVLRSTIIRLNKIPSTDAEFTALLTQVLAATRSVIEKLSLGVAQQLRPDEVGQFRAKALVDAEAAVRQIIPKIFPSPFNPAGAVQPSPPLPAPQPVPVPVPQPVALAVLPGLPPRLTKPEIEAIVNIPTGRLRRVGGGGFGETYKVDYKGRTYLRKDIAFNGERFTRWSFDTEVRYLELVCSNPLYSLIPLTPYYFGSMIRGDTGYIIEEMFSGANLQDIIDNRFVTEQESYFIKGCLEFYIRQFFHEHLGILHLDLKPLNIFIRMHENKIVSVHLLDLGLTRAIDEVGEIAGTKKFMSPQQHTAIRSGQRTIKHVKEFNIHALDIINRLIDNSTYAVDFIQELKNTTPLIPRPWEADITTSITNVLCSFSMIDYIPEEVLQDILSIPGADINNLSRDGNTPLIIALDDKNNFLSLSYINMGADVNLRNTRGTTPLHWAAASGMASPLQLLLDKGADKDALTFPTDPWEPVSTPLHWACKAIKPNTAIALLTAGANLTLRDGNGESVLDLANKNPVQMFNFIKLVESYKERTGANMGGRRNRTRHNRTRHNRTRHNRTRHNRLRNKKRYSRAK